VRLRMTTAGVAIALTGAAAAAAPASAPRPLKFKEAACVRRTDHAQVVRFRARDGVRLLGVTLGKGRVGVALGHEADGTLCRWMPFARILAKAGYRVIAFDFRNSRGSSGHVNGARSQNLDLDFVAASGVLRARGSSHVLLVGASLGGTAALVAGSEVAPSVAGVAALSPAAQWSARLDGDAAVKKLAVPVLFMAARGDTDFANDAQTLYGEAASADKRLELVAGADHGTFMLSGSSGKGPRTVLLDFFHVHSN
jgi:pimeloyl-ACP methyl ester carboxylesterase